MRDRRQLVALRHIAQVEKARRSAAESALARAREAESAARAEENVAREKAEQAHGDWYAHVQAGPFSPEHYRALGTVTVEALGKAAAAAAAAERATAQAEAGEAAWRLVEARLRRTEARIRDVKRAVARRAEEVRMAALEDRITLEAVRR